jgi:hypothetical protein
MTVKIRMVDPVKTLLGGAVGVLRAGLGLAGHAAWWLRYQVDGTARGDATQTSPEKRD